MVREISALIMLMTFFLLLKFSLLTDYGFKISRLQHLKENELILMIAALKSNDARQKYNVYRMIEHMYTNNVDGFEAVMDESLLSWGIDTTISAVILPFLEKTDILSYKDTSIEVHLVVTAIRRKIILGIEKLKPVNIHAKTSLLFLPKGEHFDLLLLYISYVLKSKGHKVLYLGTNISVENLELICKEKKPDILYSYIANKHTFPLQAYTQLLKEQMINVKLYVTYGDSNLDIGIPSDKQIKFINYRLVDTLEP